MSVLIFSVFKIKARKGNSPLLTIDDIQPDSK